MNRHFCQALDIVTDPQKVAEYRAWHRRIWPEVAVHLRAHDVIDMEIYQLGERLFMVVEVGPEFDAARFDEASLSNPDIQRWEELMWQYQVPTPWTPPGAKWVMMERIFSLQEQK
ncbi:hypothetical protein TUM12370_03130 [Salmonella enterica subsp. enterica serovar Choleraesuis]|nr:hypothetical protein TUM12370_03130 [Salmonella enterica subsp. enterica serovar Choleraesuis]